MVFSPTMLLPDFICHGPYEGTIILLHSRMTQIPALTQRISSNNTIKFCIIPAITKSESACFIPENITGKRNQQRHWKTEPRLCNPSSQSFTTSLLTIKHILLSTVQYGTATSTRLYTSFPF
jgi:hypothetical protein